MKKNFWLSLTTCSVFRGFLPWKFQKFQDTNKGKWNLLNYLNLKFWLNFSKNVRNSIAATKRLDEQRVYCWTNKACKLTFVIMLLRQRLKPSPIPLPLQKSAVFPIIFFPVLQQWWAFLGCCLSMVDRGIFSMHLRWRDNKPRLRNDFGNF